MTIGTGIAIAGVWVFAGIAWYSKNVSGVGMLTAIVVAIIITACLA